MSLVQQLRLLILVLPCSSAAPELLIPKCCDIGESFTFPTSGLPQCSSNDDGPPKLTIYNESLLPEDVPYRFIWRNLVCPVNGARYRFDEDEYYIMTNGYIHRKEYLPTNVFCLENFRNTSTGYNRTWPLFCTTNVERIAPEKFWVNAAGFFLSVPFSTATLLTFLLVEDLASLHSSIIIRYMFCHVFSCTIMGLAHLQVIPPAKSYICATTGYATQFFFMSTFFWLNVMSFDIHQAFRGFKNKSKEQQNERARKKLIQYSLYAWLSPLMILALTVFIDLHPGISYDSVFKPRVGIDKCFFKERAANWIYFYAPLALIICSNIILFSATAFRIWKQKKETAVLKKGESQIHKNSNDTERFTLYLKLFVMMGLNWVLEILSYLLYDGGYYWYVVDFSNATQGVFLFLIFVWKERVRKLIWDKLTMVWKKYMYPCTKKGNQQTNP